MLSAIRKIYNFRAETYTVANFQLCANFLRVKNVYEKTRHIFGRNMFYLIQFFSEKIFLRWSLNEKKQLEKNGVLADTISKIRVFFETSG